ncbi:MAG: hypothetical protein HY049_03095 [Acidobacteria bacterium]|nr:hypothetical protein [Acidobacteriota bacterium]
MSYSTIQPPFTLKFREMSAKELKDYNAWFHEVLPGRLVELRDEVRRTPALASWEADGTAASIDALGHWLATQVQTRSRTQGEKDAITGAAPWLDVPETELTNRSFSLAFDAGMCFGAAILRARPNARWEQELGKKRDAEYGQPVIVGLGATTLNPIRIAITLAYGIASGRRGGGRLREVYDYWVKQGS